MQDKDTKQGSFMTMGGQRETHLVSRENFIRKSGRRKVNWSESRGLNIHAYGKIAFPSFAISVSHQQCFYLLVSRETIAQWFIIVHRSLFEKQENLKIFLKTLNQQRHWKTLLHLKPVNQNVNFVISIEWANRTCLEYVNTANISSPYATHLIKQKMFAHSSARFFCSSKF